MSQLYSYKGAYPYPLPQNISDYNIEDFLLAPEKPNLNPGEVLEWGNNNWVVRPANYAETQIEIQKIRTQRNQLLQDSDIYIIRAYENGIAVSEKIKEYRQALREVPNQPNIWAVVWPVKPEE